MGFHDKNIARLTSLVLGGTGVFTAATVGAVEFVPVDDAVTHPTPVISSGPFFPGVLGQALADIDNDGDLDLFVTNAEGLPNYLFLNDGNGHFVDVAAQAGVALTDSYSVSVGLGDFDNDGLLDLLVGRQSNSLGESAHPLLLKNMGLNRAGIPSFVDVSVESGLAALASSQKALGFATADFDVDGNLDVFIASFDLSLSGDAGLAIGTSDPNLLLMNQGATGEGIPTFVDTTTTAGVAGIDVFGRSDETADQAWKPHTWVTYTSDVNADGLMDIFALNEAPGYLELYINQGDGSFEAQQEPHNLLAGGFMGISSADVNSDGHLDYFVTNLGAEYFVLGLPPEINIGSVGTEEGTPFNLLLINDGQGNLASLGSSTEITPSSLLPPLAYDTQAGFDAYGFGWGPTFFDANNDGAKDLYWVGSHWPGMPLNGVGRYLEGDGAGAFTDLTAEANLFNIPADQDIDFANAHNGYSALSGDIDGDGDSDLVVINGSDSAAASAPAGVRVFRNIDGNNARQLIVNLRSRSGNTFGIGARVELLSISTGSAQAKNITAHNIESLAISEFDQVQIAEIVTSTGAFSATQPLATFGLGSDTGLHLVKVTWPDGAVSRRLVKPTDTAITVRKR